MMWEKEETNRVQVSWRVKAKVEMNAEADGEREIR